jgi:hypothetical protein
MKWLLTILLFGTSILNRAKEFEPHQIRLMDDSGFSDSQWLMLSNPKTVLRKNFKINFTPDNIKNAVLEYYITSDPYDPNYKMYISDPNDGSTKWANIIIRVNDTTILDQPAGPYIGKGPHRIPVPHNLLKQGVNRIDFKWKELPEDKQNKAQYGYIYFSIDKPATTPGNSYVSNNSGQTFQPATQSNTPSELVVRLLLTITSEK